MNKFNLKDAIPITGEIFIRFAQNNLLKVCLKKQRILNYA